MQYHPSTDVIGVSWPSCIHVQLINFTLRNWEKIENLFKNEFESYSFLCPTDYCMRAKFELPNLLLEILEKGTSLIVSTHLENMWMKFVDPIMLTAVSKAELPILVEISENKALSLIQSCFDHE